MSETRFLHEPAELQRRARKVRAVLFDWDGVFNDGWKDLDGGSPFSEVGSMGVNMLRFALWLRNGVNPPSAVIMMFVFASSTRSTIAWLENPPKMTECAAPSRTQASIAMTASGTIGM